MNNDIIKQNADLIIEKLMQGFKDTHIVFTSTPTPPLRDGRFGWQMRYMRYMRIADEFSSEGEPTYRELSEEEEAEERIKEEFFGFYRVVMNQQLGEKVFAQAVHSPTFDTRDPEQVVSAYQAVIGMALLSTLNR